jgi:glycosyltransferase involved in cell wall biosynthesis
MNSIATADALAGKRIVLLIGHFGRGGCQRQAFLLARELRHRGMDAEVWSLMSDGYDAAYAEEFVAAGLPIRVLGFRRPIFSSSRLLRGVGWAREVRRMVRQLRARRIEVLLPYTTWPNIVAGLSYRLAGVNVCIWGERSAGTERAPTPERIAVRQYRRFVANSAAGVEFLGSELQVPRDRIALIPNGVELPVLASTTDWRAKLGISPEQLMVVKIANLSVFKDHATLLRAWRMVQDAWQDGEAPVLVMAGARDNNVEECERMIRELDLASAVRLPGSVSDIAGLLHACDMTAFSSRKEGMPNAVLECMAAGKAVVASDLPGVRDGLGADAAGLLVSPGDAAGFATLLLDLLRNKTARDRLGFENRRRIQTEFSVERLADRQLAVVKQCYRQREAGWRLRAWAAGTAGSRGSCT